MLLWELVRRFFVLISLIGTWAWAFDTYSHEKRLGFEESLAFVAAFGAALLLEPILARKRLGASKHDRELHAMLLAALPEEQIRFLRDHDFLTPFQRSRRDDLFTFIHEWKDDPTREFIDERLEKLKKSLHGKGDELVDAMVTFTCPEHGPRGLGENQWFTVWLDKDHGPPPERIQQEAKKMNMAAEAFVSEFDRFVRGSRKLLAK